MKKSSDLPILLLGLQDSGKSNFIVGLDVVLGDLVDAEGLVHCELAEDRSFLQPLRERWMRAEELDRTSGQTEPQIHQLIVKHQSSGKRIVLNIPDHAGESFSSAFVSRSFTNEFCERLQRAAGLLVFVHCRDNADHELHEEAIFSNPGESVTTTGGEPIQAVEFDPEAAAKQIKLVDLLQFSDEVRDGMPPLRIAVIVSAWDLIKNAPQGVRRELPTDPVQFLEKRWPLLHQFLESNSDRFVSRVFGVSARGGSGDERDLDTMLSHPRPADRVIVVDGEHVSRDITRPIRWLLELISE